MRARLCLLGTDLYGECDGVDLRLPLSDVLAELRSWASAYERAVRVEDAAELLALGQRMFARLDGSGWASRWVGAPGDRVLEVAVQDVQAPEAAALFDAPWELLAAAGDFLSFDPSQTFIVFRSVGRMIDAQPIRPAFRDLAVLFMAAAPEEESELDFEAEEVAILEATSRLPLHLLVEESGCATFLRDRVSQEGPFEVVHLSCHGDVRAGQPVLELETPEGRVAPTNPGEIVQALGERKIPLVFLSACRTAEASLGGVVTEPFVRNLIRAGVPNVLGWDGAVDDADAIHFARTFYAELAAQATVPYAAAVARREVLTVNRRDPERGQHWHLARVYAGPAGAGACCDRGRPQRTLRTTGGFKEFLDKAQHRVPVATARTFVGRRRQAQTVLRHFREGTHAGVLLFGMGHLGKSSLAARIANRLPTHQPVVIFKRYDAQEIFERVLSAAPPTARARAGDQWRPLIRANGAVLGDALEDLLGSAFEQNPLLLIIDDLEQILTIPAPDEPVSTIRDAPGDPDVWRHSLAAVLRAFRATRTDSRLLLTSRYDFSLTDGEGHDLTNRLARVQLLPMTPRQRRKQWQAARQLAHAATSSLGHDSPDDAPGDVIVARALQVAGGNPGLQEILCRPLLAGEVAAAVRAIDAVEHFVHSGETPTEASAAQEFFERVSFAIYQDALTDAERDVLRTTTLFGEGLPIPVAGLIASANARGIERAPECLRRLIALGLVDDWGMLSGTPHAAINPLARALVPGGLHQDEIEACATAVLPALRDAWQNTDGDFPIDSSGVEVARWAQRGGAAADLLEAAVLAAARFVFRRQDDAPTAWTILEPALAEMEARDYVPRFPLTLLAADCAERLGKTEVRIALLERALRAPAADPVGLAQVTVRHAEATLTRDGPGPALARMREAVSLFESVGDERSRTITMGKIADVLQEQGKTDEALRIRREEELPSYERLGDVRERAITMGKIADVLEQRSEFNEALRVRREEELPVYERLGEVRERGIAMSKIANLLLRRGESDEAMRILREEQLPLFDRLGDIRLRAFTIGQIADVLEHRGQTDEALRIRREEELPVYDRVGDIRTRAYTMSQIASVLHLRGETDEALRILREEALPIYDRLGDAYARALAMGQIADILEQRGQTDEALRIRREEELPVYDRIGDVHARAITMGQIADTLQQRGQIDEALRIYREDLLPVFDRLGDARERAITVGKIAGILHLRGQMDEALRIRREEELPVYERLGDIHARAVTMGQIADILQLRGQIDEALRIHREEQLPVYDRLGDIRARAIAMGQIANILQLQGQMDEALRIRREEQLPVFDRLGDVYSRAIILGRIAEILQQRGEADEALRIHRDEQLPVYERLGDVRLRAITMGGIADVLQSRGEIDEALRIRREEQLPVFERLGDVRARAVTMGKIADVLQQRGEIDEALRIRREEQLAVFERLGDVRERIRTMDKIADALKQRGEADKALQRRAASD